MGVFTFNDEFTSPIAPARLFKALVLDADNLIPKIVPHAAQSVEILEGNGGPGTIKKITFADGKYVKHKVDSLDHNNLAHCYSLIEGHVLSAELEKVSHDTKFGPAPGGGSIIKVSTTFYTVGDAKVNEEKAKEGKEKNTGLFKLVEGYLQANPGAYN